MDAANPSGAGAGANELVRRRLEKLNALRAGGTDPFGQRFAFTHWSGDLVRRYHTAAEDELKQAEPVTVAGRVVALRHHGKTCFAHLRDQSGRIQLYARQDALGERYPAFTDLDVGDFIGVTGELFRTRTGELTVAVREFVFLAKAIRPLPEKWHGLKDVETRYRRRYVDLVMNPEVREAFVVKSRLIRAMRAFLDARGFLEVETPMMQPIPGGATAKPFVTHHNALDMPLYLRIAPELYLKRLVVGGLDRVYEINRNFRNEGISTQHNPEFTMLEFYEAYSNYRDLMEMNEQLFALLVKNITGSTTVKYGEHELDFAKFQRLSMRQAIVKCWPAAAGAAPTEAQLSAPGGPRKFAERYNLWAARTGAPPVPAKGAVSDGEWSGRLFEAVAEDKLIQPTILYDFPTDISPLSKQKPDDPSLTERFEVFAAGMEVANGFSELNDPAEQQRRFLQQMAQGGEDVPKQLDVDYLRALCHGLPPTAGEGIGIDRLTMLLTDSHSIRDVILFPLLRPEGGEPSSASEAHRA